MSDLFFGFDLSTQQLKLLVTDNSLKLVNTFKIEFDKDLPSYGTNKGVFSNEETGEIIAPIKLWIEALDIILQRMQKDGFPFHQVAGISGSGQQHGSVYWSNQAPDLLQDLDPSKSLNEQLSPNGFTLQTSPNWQDHSTGEEISLFESYVGGAENLAKLTGSRAHYRFTGPQIRKIVKTKPEIYENTYKISLVSSFLASLLLGEITGIEEGEACGMNLYDIKGKKWDENLLAIGARVHEKDGISDPLIRENGVKLLRSKLGEVVKMGADAIGEISGYYIKKYGFSKHCKIYPFTGDNLATVLALPLDQNEILISLGTSTTVLLVTKNYIPSSNYHLFIHPTIPDSYMGMICYCNGSVAREKVRDQVNEKYKKSSNDWSLFNEILEKTEHFDKRLGCYFPLGEIVPDAKAQTLRAKINDDESIEIIDSWDVELDVSSIVESQALSCRARSCPMISLRDDLVHNSTGKDLEFDGKIISRESLNQRPNKVSFVGGASSNKSIVKTFGKILGSLNGNFRFDNSNSCAIGGAYKATWAFQGNDQNRHIGFHEFLSSKFNWSDLEEVKTIDRWEEYQIGLSGLQKIEKNLKK